MILCNIDAVSWVVGTPITLVSPSVSTNGNIELNSTKNAFLVKNPGWYKVRLQAVVSASGTSLGARLKADDTIISESEVTITTEEGNDYEIYIEYPVRVVSTPEFETASIEIIPTGAGDPEIGHVFIDRVE